MKIRNTSRQYGWLAKFFHWSLLVLLVIAVVLGSCAAGLPIGAEKTNVLWYHKSFGVLVFVGVILRLIWRWANPTPAHAAGVSRPQQMVSGFVHGSMYFLLLMQPITGIVMSQSYGYPAVLFSLVELPVIVPVDEALGLLSGAAHGFIWMMLAFLVLVHVAAALHHHFVRRDDVLRRMSFFSDKS